MRKLALLGAVAAIAMASPAYAAYNFTVYTGNTGSSFNAVNGNTSLFTAANDSSRATFTYTGALNFSNTAGQNNSNAGDLNSSFFTDANLITNFNRTMGDNQNSYNWSGMGKGGFLAASGSIQNYAYGSLYLIDSETGNYSGQRITIRHDDGVSLYINGDYVNAVGGFTSGPTSAITESYTFGSNVTSYRIVYGRENGSPSVLQVALAVPEPATWGMMVLGFGAVGFAARRRSKVSGRVVSA